MREFLVAFVFILFVLVGLLSCAFILTLGLCLIQTRGLQYGLLVIGAVVMLALLLAWLYW